MDILPEIETLQFWLTQYGSIVLFILLMLGIVAFPVPEETLMVVTGILIRNGTLPLHSTLFATYAGSMVGITVSYLIGATAGIYFIKNFGSWVGLKEYHLEKAHSWFEHFGKWSLFIGYFIPGVRHFTGFCAGMAALDYKQFALYAYTGAIFWVTSFVSIGYFSGHYWLMMYHRLNLYISIDTLFLILICMGAIAVLIYFHFRKRT